MNEKLLLLVTYALISEMESQNGLRYQGTQLYFDLMTTVVWITGEWEKDDFYSDHGYTTKSVIIQIPSVRSFDF